MNPEPATTSGPAYTIAHNNAWIQCHLCGRTSYNPQDVQHVYCGFCHLFHLDEPVAKDLPGHQHRLQNGPSTRSIQAVQGIGAGSVNKGSAPPHSCPNVFGVEACLDGRIEFLISPPSKIRLPRQMALHLAAWLTVAVDPDGEELAALVEGIKGAKLA